MVYFKIGRKQPHKVNIGLYDHCLPRKKENSEKQTKQMTVIMGQLVKLANMISVGHNQIK